MPSMLFDYSHRVLLAVHTAEPPVDAEWDAYMNLCEKVVAQMKCNIVYTEGGGPNARQRTRINKLDALKPTHRPEGRDTIAGGRHGEHRSGQIRALLHPRRGLAPVRRKICKLPKSIDIYHKRFTF